MAEFFTAQMDYVFFVYGLAFVLLAAVCLSLGRQARQTLPWHWLAAFGLLHGLNEWLDLAAIGMADGETFRWVLRGRLGPAVRGPGGVRPAGPGAAGRQPDARAVAGSGPGLAGLRDPGSWAEHVCSGRPIASGFHGRRSGGGSALEGLAPGRRFAVAGPDGRSDAGLRRGDRAGGAAGATSGRPRPQPGILPGGRRRAGATGGAAAGDPDGDGDPLPLPDPRRGDGWCKVAAVVFSDHPGGCDAARAAGGWVLAEKQGRHEDQECRQALLGPACAVAATTEATTLTQSAAGPEDLTKEPYNELRQQFMRAAGSLPDCRQVYLMRLKGGQVVFAIDSLPERGPEHTDSIHVTPAQEYSDAPPCSARRVP